MKNTTKLSEMDRPALIEWAATGGYRMFGARVGRVLALAAKRGSNWEESCALRNAINDRRAALRETTPNP